jgi:hypothetical protein
VTHGNLCYSADGLERNSLLFSLQPQLVAESFHSAPLSRFRPLVYKPRSYAVSGRIDPWFRQVKDWDALYLYGTKVVSRMIADQL